MQRFVLILLMAIFFLWSALNGKVISKEPVKAVETQGPKVFNWILEDPNPDDGWEFSATWMGDTSEIGTVTKDKNILVSKKEAHSGKTSLMLEIEHNKRGYCGAMMTTSEDGEGTPARSWEEANKGKDISNCDTLEFWVKGEGKAKVKEVKIELVDSNDLSTSKVILLDYINPTNKWEKVQIPIDEFGYINGFDKTSLKAITFLVEQNDPPGKYTLYVDDVRFINTGIKLKKRFKIVFEDPSIDDGAWNFSGVWEGNGTKIEVGPNAQDKNIPISIDEKYQGFTSLKFYVNQKKGGYAGAWFSGNFQGKGVPPDNWEDYDTPKDISPYNAIQVYTKIIGKGVCGRFELGDVNKNASSKIDVAKYLKVLNKWEKVVIPFKDINWQKFDKTKFKEFKFMLDDDCPAGEYFLYIDNLEFIELPELK